MTTKTPRGPLVSVRLTPADQAIIDHLIREQHEAMKASGAALIVAPTAPDVIRWLIAREGARLAETEVRVVRNASGRPIGVTGGTEEQREAKIEELAAEAPEAP